MEIQSVHANDGGEYACQLGTLVPKEIVHSLEVLGMTHRAQHCEHPIGKWLNIHFDYCAMVDRYCQRKSE